MPPLAVNNPKNSLSIQKEPKQNQISKDASFINEEDESDHSDHSSNSEEIEQDDYLEDADSSFDEEDDQESDSLPSNEPKKTKRTKKAFTSLGGVMGHILSRKLIPETTPSSSLDPSSSAPIPSSTKAKPDPNPILFKRPHILQEINQHHLEEKAKKALSLQKKLERESRAKRSMSEVDWDLNEERRLRKVATRGVVKLFNAIKLAQKAVVVEDNKSKNGRHQRQHSKASVGHGDESTPSTLSKSGFLDLLKSSALSTSR